MQTEGRELVLTAHNLSKEFPGTLALDSVNMEIRPGEVVALLGENGAGKSTLANLIAGMFEPSSGTMELNGHHYAPRSPHDAQAKGIALVHQETTLLPDLSIAENVLLGNWPKRGGVVDKREMKRVAKEKLDMLGFRPRLGTPVASLSVAAQQQVEFAKALAQNASIILLDEPTTALSGGEVEALFSTVRSLKAKGVGFIYVSHRLDEIAQICDRVVVLRDGAEVAVHDSAAIPTSTLISEMVGRSVERLFPKFAPASENVVLNVGGLGSPVGAFTDISFDVHAGEVFGIAGLVGAGRTELLRGIAGVDPVKTGTVKVDGVPVRRESIRDAIRAGIALVPEDRKAQGIIVGDTIRENVLIPNLGILSKRGIVDDGELDAATMRMIDEMGVRGKATDVLGGLSGGNQQKVVIGRWLLRSPNVMLLDEPTRGIDVGARAAIYETIAGLAASGMAVVVVSSDLDEVLGLSSRVMVLSRGENRGVLTRNEATPARVMELATTNSPEFEKRIAA